MAEVLAKNGTLERFQQLFQRILQYLFSLPMARFYVLLMLGVGLDDIPWPMSKLRIEAEGYMFCDM
jgi:hypothetical protein